MLASPEETCPDVHTNPATEKILRLAALYAILQIGRQPSFGGGGLATAKMQASNDPVMTNATSKQLWTFVALLLRRQLLQQCLRVLQVARVEALRKPPVRRPAVRALALA
jgi:hypothetical protein